MSQVNQPSGMGLSRKFDNPQSQAPRRLVVSPRVLRPGGVPPCLPGGVTTWPETGPSSGHAHTTAGSRLVVGVLHCPMHPPECCRASRGSVLNTSPHDCAVCVAGCVVIEPCLSFGVCRTTLTHNLHKGCYQTADDAGLAHLPAVITARSARHKISHEFRSVAPA